MCFLIKEEYMCKIESLGQKTPLSWVLKLANLIKAKQDEMSAPTSPRDNAVIESFFGHLKDEICLIGLKTFEQVTQVIDDYMYYYNNEK